MKDESEHLALELIFNVEKGIYDLNPEVLWKSLNIFFDKGKLSDEDANYVRLAMTNRKLELMGFA